MDRTTMVVALVHCLSNQCPEEIYSVANCNGCPLQGEEGCRFHLKMAVVKALLTKGKIFVPPMESDNGIIPCAIEEILGGEFNA